MHRVISSLIDNDLYKLTMGQAVFRTFDRINVGYHFIDRGNVTYPEGFAEKVREQINLMADLALTSEEKTFLNRRCGHYLRPSFIDWFSHYQFDPREVTVTQDDGKLSVFIEGPWYRTIYWEVPLLAIISQLYYEELGLEPESHFQVKAFEKGRDLHIAGAKFADFGSRRRFSTFVHNQVLKYLQEGAQESLIGSSNLLLAMKYNLTPIGTHAHEWFMAMAGLFGYRMATRIALEMWSNEFEGNLGTALTDTFTSAVFLHEFNAYYAKLFDGVRQDSGDPFLFADRIIEHYKHFGIDPMSKRITFTDSLNTTIVTKLLASCRDRIQCMFGIGTNFTNDVGHAPLNIVIKLNYVIRPEEPDRIIYVTKLSDTFSKASGTAAVVAACRAELGIAA